MSSSSSLDDSTAVVIILGSSSIQAGFAGYEAPYCVEPSVVGSPKVTVEPIMLGIEGFERCPGNLALSKCDVLNLCYPIERGVVKDWDEFELLMDHIFKTILKVSIEDHSLLISESPLNPRENHERLYQLFFETFSVPRMRIEVDTLLSMYSAGGRTTGLLVSSGGGVTSVLPVYEGYAIQSAMKRLDIGGSDVTEYLTTLLTERGYYFRTSTDREIVRRMKESLAYVSCNFNQDMVWTQMSAETERLYELPDGNKITISHQLFQCTECPFQPLSQLGREHAGIHQLIHNSIKECDIDVRRDLYSNIILAGGNTMLPGFSERIQKEITNLAPPKSNVKVVCPPERKYSTWKGGSILTSLTSFQSTWVDRLEYDLEDPRCSHEQFH
eukprot:TRINITY_DN2024_c0_g1_i1.p1 TRINITY_DN2024_c0_g1~~TRINITY_DN2024_c0_g1_i1.p1  ORF type:complete len:403 (-),score=72.28 TRINITY_DN2024_c0_g1_i1:85-1239(-)